jgi:hypothetical protein
MLSTTIPKPASPFVRLVLQSTDGRYFENTPAFPRLTKNRKQAREFADEILADAFRELIEIRSGFSFTVFAIAGRY